MAESNRFDAATTLLIEINAWCKRTGCMDTLIGRVLYRHPGLVPLMRQRLTVSPEKEQAIRAFMERNPDGWSGELPKCSGYGITRPLRSAKVRLAMGPPSPVPEPRRPFQSAYSPSAGPNLPRGQRVVRQAEEEELRRKIEGLRGFRLHEEFYRARQSDGRPLMEFIESLLWMGLACWEDDRRQELGLE